MSRLVCWREMVHKQERPTVVLQVLATQGSFYILFLGYWDFAVPYVQSNLHSSYVSAPQTAPRQKAAVSTQFESSRHASCSRHKGQHCFPWVSHFPMHWWWKWWWHGSTATSWCWGFICSKQMEHGLQQRSNQPEPRSENLSHVDV